MPVRAVEVPSPSSSRILCPCHYHIPIMALAFENVLNSSASKPVLKSPSRKSDDVVYIAVRRCLEVVCLEELAIATS